MVNKNKTINLIGKKIKKRFLIIQFSIEKENLDGQYAYEKMSNLISNQRTGN